jgi:O-acetyl-ADP-ribose deacetylase (regulator of RNase III)
MNKIYGDIIQAAESGKYDVVLHNCNCFCTMGSGVALCIANAWPEVAAADCATQKGDISKLGTYSRARVVRGDIGFNVYNIYGQYKYGYRSLQLFDIDAFAYAIDTLATELQLWKRPVNILFPPLGAGSAGGRWRHISNVLTTQLSNHNLTLIKLK